MGNTCVGTGCCNPKSNGSNARKPLDKPFTDPSPGESFLMCSTYKYIFLKVLVTSYLVYSCNYTFLFYSLDKLKTKTKNQMFLLLVF